MVPEMEEVGWELALQRFGERMRVIWPNYTRSARGFTCGKESLHECYPRLGLAWLRDASAALTNEYMPFALEAVFRDPDLNLEPAFDPYSMSRVVDCLGLKLVPGMRAHTPYGHLGTHGVNLALTMWGTNRAFRTKNYVDLYCALFDPGMIRNDGTDGSCLDMAYYCRQGKHRSVSWCAIEQIILWHMGMSSREVEVCGWKKAKSWCQRGRGGCGECDGLIEPGDVRWELGRAAAAEFFEVVACLNARSA